MKPKISILVGSGFSIPEGIPSVKELNRRLSKINESEIMINSDQRAFFLNGQKDPNSHFNLDEKVFLQKFLEFYNSEVLKKDEEFHYETFYDYYSSYLYNCENKESIEEFCKKFNEKYFKGQDDIRDCQNRISDFNRTFNQLLAAQLHKIKYFNDISFFNYHPYESFINFLIELLKTRDIKFHSLNHDLFFDWIGHHHSELSQHFTDGFQLAGSPFYGTISYDFNAGTEHEVHKTYYVKLEQFVNKFDKPLTLFKLHGSIYNKIVQTPYPDQKKIRIKDNYAIYQYYMEITDSKNGKQGFHPLFDEVSPDFLSGTTNKIRYYKNDSYYINLFKHFEKNLTSSELLVVIGYGFQDSGINDYLEQFYLSKGKHMIIIDPSRPQSYLLNKYKITYIPKGITQMTYQDFLDLIPK